MDGIAHVRDEMKRLRHAAQAHQGTGQSAQDPLMNQQIGEVLSEAYGHANRLTQRCASELSRSQADGCLSSDLAELKGAFSRHAEAVHQASHGAADASKCWRDLEDATQQRRKLEAELMKWQAVRRSAQARKAAVQKAIQRERALSEQWLKLREAETRLELPLIDFDIERGSIRLGDPPPEGVALPTTSLTEAVRTIAVEFGEDGNLLRAEPHPSLNLQKEAALAVKLNDIARLLTRVWCCLCKAMEDKTPGKMEVDSF